MNNTNSELLTYFDQMVCVHEEMIEDNGEDSYFYSINENVVAGGVFDGCGGSGARKYDAYDGHTGAYVGSRILSGVTCDYMNEKAQTVYDTEWTAQLKSAYQDGLLLYKQSSGAGKGFKGTMIKDFPSTAAFAASYPGPEGLVTRYIWAGDSRGYILTEKGLCQVTEDDLEGEDALSNLTNDGVLTNVISASEDFTLHTKTITYDGPCIIVNATDGCFNYLSSPMEFEYILLDTMMRAHSPNEWQQNFSDYIRKVTGDDYTMTCACFGYGAFQNMQAAYDSRYRSLYEKYVAKWAAYDEQQRLRLWQEYQQEVDVIHE